MTKILSIVAATDFSAGSNAAVERAVQLAVAHGATLHLVHAFDISAWHSLKKVFDLQEFVCDPPPDVLMRRRLVDTANSLQAQTGLKVVAEFGTGAAHTMIEAHVKAHASSLVVVGSRADPVAIGLGSTAAKVVGSAACPVLIVRLPAAAAYDKVLTAVDVSEESTTAAAFAVALFPIAHHHLLYLLDPGLDRALWMGGFTTEHARAQRDSMHAHAARELQQLAQALAREATHPVTVDVVEDVPARAIVAAADAMHADCVVVGHHRRNPQAESPLGNIAQHVAHQTTRDVLVVPAAPV